MSGIGPRPEAGCNCRHLPDRSTCFECSRYGSDGQKLIADGGRDDWFTCDDCGAEYRNGDGAERCCTDTGELSVEERLTRLEEAVEKREGVDL